MELCPGISIIIPTFNESEFIGPLVRYLKINSPDNTQVIVSDGGSTDGTIIQAGKEGVEVVRSPKKGRAVQMNYGASFANETILYFVHADCFPPANFYRKIIESLQGDFIFGRFQTKFNSKSRLLRLNAFFTRFDWFICYGGDQTLFIKKEVFEEINGFNDELLLMEDYDIVKRARQHYRYAILKEKVLVSARKYHTNSWIKVQQAHRKIIKMYRNGANQEALVETYRALLNYRY